jgi:hypothetical protein
MYAFEEQFPFFPDFFSALGIPTYIHMYVGIHAELRLLIRNEIFAKFSIRILNIKSSLLMLC